jgi:hypothetical protein
LDAVAPLKKALREVKNCKRASGGGCPMLGEMKSLAEKGFSAVSKDDLHKVIMSAEGYFAGREPDCRAMVLVHEAYLYLSIS